MRRITLFLDIDGTLLEHQDTTSNIIFKKPIALEHVVLKMNEWDKKGYCIILTTARKESMRLVTEKQLGEVGISYDQLIMGIGSGPRYLINDEKDGKETAFGITVKRNVGFRDLNL